MVPVLHTCTTLGQREAAAAKRVILSGQINDGVEGRHLAADVAQAVGAAGGLVASTGTHAILLALRALGVCRPEHLVALPDFSCRAVYDAVRLSGATAVFVDIDETLTMSPDSLKTAANMGLSAIVLPHLFGHLADIKAIDKFGVPIIEDCAHSPGAMLEGRKAGSFGQFATFSFEGSKYVTAGEGGVVVARSKDDLALLDQAKMGGEVAQQCRLSDVVSAVARVQWGRLQQFVEKRRRLALRYRRLLDLSAIGGVYPQDAPGGTGGYYRFIVLADPQIRDELLKTANEAGICLRHPIHSGCLSISLPGRSADGLPTSRIIDRRIVSLPIYPNLSYLNQDRVIAFVNSFVRLA